MQREAAFSDPFAYLIHALRQALQPPVTTPSLSASVSLMAQSVTSSGEVEGCSRFLLQCSLFFEMQPQLFTNDCAKITYIIFLLSG